ncbi:MAG: hypothetical protein ACYTGZ_00115 [Planctomycetota bacterium]|jgi:hypothetical protein
MKIVPILAITNAVALGIALVLYIEVDDLKSQVGSARHDSRGGEVTVSLEEFEALKDRVARQDEQWARLGSEGTPTDAGLGTDSDAPAPSKADGKAIDRTYAAVDFDEEAERKNPEMEFFRHRVRLAQDINNREERVTRTIDRVDGLISSKRIGPLQPEQKKKAAETLVDASDKTRLIWSGLRVREDLNSLPDDQRRTAYRDEYRKESTAIRTATQKALESLMPAADAKTLTESIRGGDFGGRRGTPRTSTRR